MSQKFDDPNELIPYEKHFSEEGLWDKIKKVAKLAGKKVIYMALVLYYTMASPNVSNKDKGIIAGVLGYFILPIDLIPDIIPFLGFTDDAAALLLVYNTLQACITPEIKQQAVKKMLEWFKD